MPPGIQFINHTALALVGLVMAVVSGCPLFLFPFPSSRVGVSSPPSIPISNSKSQPRLSVRVSSSSNSMDSNNCQGEGEGEGSSRQLMEFPYSSPPVRKLMVDLVSTVESRLSTHLLPCTLPPDVQLYRNPDPGASAVSSLLIRSGAPSSPIDFILASWLHCKLPTGAGLSITSLSCYLDDVTDSPNFLMEIIQSSATSMIIALDLYPRKDLVLHPDYLQTFYEDTQLDKQRQLLYTLPEVQPYFSPSLYVRSALSPTAVLVRIETHDSESRLDEIVEGTVDPVAKQFLAAWFDCLARGNKDLTNQQRRLLKERDRMFKRQTIEIDLASSLPRMFGQHTADRVLGVIADIFTR